MNPSLPLFAVGLAMLAAVAVGNEVQQKKPPRKTDPPEWLKMRQIIRGEAIRQGVPVELALATARVESSFNPNAEGDLNWHLNRARFDKFVPRENPFRSQPQLWHSYGLFQLLAPYHVKGAESPLVLLDPKVNTERGVRVLRRLLYEHRGDPDLVRLHYTNGDAADASTQARILSAWHKSLQTERGHLA